MERADLLAVRSAPRLAREPSDPFESHAVSWRLKGESGGSEAVRVSSTVLTSRFAPEETTLAHRIEADEFDDCKVPLVLAFSSTSTVRWPATPTPGTHVTGGPTETPVPLTSHRLPWKALPTSADIWQRSQLDSAV
mmetsp:Transcript_58766/g.110862  ORF Transcript_58766/g.110862 Transcript_58766/m.110862 type:complete len:136 (+) Transcript_58766:1322-1729(+)